MTEQDQPYQPLNWRLYLIVFLMGFCVLAIIWKVARLQIIDHDFLQGQGDARTYLTLPLVAHRGMITDRNGEPLAVSTPVESIWVNPRVIAGATEDIIRLARELDMDSSVLVSKIQRNQNKKFSWVKRRLSPQFVEHILDLDIDGVYSRQEFKRFYPQGEATAHIVGRTNIDDEGQEGLELSYDEWLNGVQGRKRVMQDRRGHIIEEINILETAQPGKNLELSIDFRIQNLAYKELKAEVIYRHANSGMAIVMDVETGEVLAMVNQPSYNPNHAFNLADFSALRNRSITDLFEPGSTIKPFTAVAALESGLFSPHTLVDTSPGRIRVGNHTVRDHGNNYGEITVAGVITNSSNVGATKLAFAVGSELMIDVFKRVGFGESTASGFPGERGGVIHHSLTSGQKAELSNMSFGHGFTTTALQLARSYMIFANDGIRKPVSLLKLSVDQLASLSQERVISSKVNSQVFAMLKAVVVNPEDGGGAKEARVPYYTVAGKTGTAEVAGKDGYAVGQNNSLFAGMAPASSPKIVVVVIINEPKGDEQFGSLVAAPVFSRIVAGSMRILNIPPDQIESNYSLRISSL